MSSFPSPDDSTIASPKDSWPNRYSNPPVTPITTSRGKGSVGPEPELQAILQEARERTAATGAAIALSTEDALCCRASTGYPAPEVGTRLQAGISLTRLCLATGEILLCNDTKTDRRVDPKLCKEEGIQSVLILPIKRNAKVVGVLEVLSTSPNAFNQHDATVMSKLADRVLPVSSESARIPDQCLDHLPSKDIEGVRNLQKLLGNADELEEHNDSLATTAAAQAPQGNDQDIRSQLSDQAVTIGSREYSGAARWLITGLATAFALAVTFGYGYHLHHPRVATHIAPLPIAATNHTPTFPNPRRMLSEPDKKTNGQPKASESVLTASRQEVILAIQEVVQGTDGNRILNRAEAGDSIAQYEMALRYADGEGVSQNYQSAMAWFAKAAANGNNDAQWKLGLGYIKGIGVPHDERKAAVWFKRAANHGDIRAQSALSDLYLSGRGVPRDYVRAYTWAAIATGMRENDNDRLRVIGSRMTIVQIEDAHRRISSWRKHQTLKAAPPVTSQNVPDVSRK
jgi:putative methionine-R-sulfoxide reductase with GAF domain